MVSSRRFLWPASLLVSFVYAPEINSHIMHNWSSEGLDAVLLIKLLNVIPNRICFRQHHTSCDFAGRIVSVGRVIGECVFAASLIKISDDVFGCAKAPFHCFGDSEIDVLVELNDSGQSLSLRILYHGTFSTCHD